jgi:hypothetical protein
VRRAYVLQGIAILATNDDRTDVHLLAHFPRQLLGLHLNNAIGAPFAEKRYELLFLGVECIFVNNIDETVMAI